MSFISAFAEYCEIRRLVETREVRVQEMIRKIYVSGHLTDLKQELAVPCCVSYFQLAKNTCAYWLIAVHTEHLSAVCCWFACYNRFEVIRAENMAKSLWTAFTEFRLGPETYCAMAYLFQFLNKRLDYKLLSLTYEVLTTSQPDYIHTQSYLCSVCR